MARYTYTIPRNTKGEGRILMIFTKKSFLWTVACAFVGLIVGYLPIGVIFQHPFIGIAITLIFALIGFGIATLKVPNSSNFELFRKTGGENIDEIIMRAIKFKKQGKKLSESIQVSLNESIEKENKRKKEKENHEKISKMV